MTEVLPGAASTPAAASASHTPLPRPVTPGRGRRTGRATPMRVVVVLLLSLVAVAFAYPFIWLVSASFKPRGEVFDNALIPRTFTWDNYVQVWQEAPLALWLFNTVLVTVLAALTMAGLTRPR